MTDDDRVCIQMPMLKPDPVRHAQGGDQLSRDTQPVRVALTRQQLTEQKIPLRVQTRSLDDHQRQPLIDADFQHSPDQRGAHAPHMEAEPRAV